MKRGGGDAEEKPVKVTKNNPKKKPQSTPKATPASTKTNDDKKSNVVKKSSLIYPGNKKKQSIWIGPCRVHVDVKRQFFRVVLKPGKERQFRWTNDDPKKLWQRVLTAISEFGVKL